MQRHGAARPPARSLARWCARARRALRAAPAITTVPRVPPPPAPQHSDALPSPRIRRADAVDLDALVALEERVFRHDRLSRAQFRRHLDSDSALVLIAKEDGRLLGVAVVFFRRGARVARLYSLVTAPEAPPEAHYRWLGLLEQHWIGAEQGNQISYTLKLFTDRHDLEAFRAIVRRHQPEIRCCAVLPSRPDHALGYEYLPEEEIAPEAFAALTARIATAEEAVDLAQLQCASGVCPI